MTQVAIGVAVHAEPDGLRATLDSLARHTSIEYDCLVIPDGADAATRAALTELRDVVVLDDPGPRGEAACLNVLARTADAHILVLLESGCRVAPGSLEALVTALTSFPTAGLAGPSTNRSWNEQRVFPNAGGSVEDLVRIAGAPRRHAGG